MLFSHAWMNIFFTRLGLAKLIFPNIYLIMKILSPVSHLCHFKMILSNHNKIPGILGI